jgi:hypothetical protein
MMIGRWPDKPRRNSPFLISPAGKPSKCRGRRRPGRAGAVHKHIWSADPRSPRDQPQDVAVFRTPSDTVWRIVILRPGEVDAMRVQEA